MKLSDEQSLTFYEDNPTYTDTHEVTWTEGTPASQRWKRGRSRTVPGNWKDCRSP